MSTDVRERSTVTLFPRERPLRPDLFLIVPYLVLSAFGLLMVYSASAPRLEALGIDPARDLKRQAVFVVLGFVVFTITSAIDIRSVRAWVPLIYGVAVVTLVLVLSPAGENVKGAQRWIPLGPFQFQPSEVAKIAVVLGLAALLAGSGPGPLRWHRVVRALSLVGLPAVLIFFQPDLGTMLVFAFVVIVMLFAANATWRQLASLVIAALVGTTGIFRMGAIRAYQLARLTAFLDPTAHPIGAGYNQLQSEIAIGTGGLAGKGLFQGSQTNLRFVPEQTTDFIFTAVGEQFGFLGSAFVIVLYGLIVWRILVAAASAPDRFSRLVAVGVAGLVAFHVFVNIGMTVRLMPVTGLPLPFMSAGGTVFLALSAALGLAHSVWLRRTPSPGERFER